MFPYTSLIGEAIEKLLTFKSSLWSPARTVYVPDIVRPFSSAVRVAEPPVSRDTVIEEVSRIFSDMLAIILISLPAL